MKGKKFIASYSGGKDSVLAIYRAIQSGLVPLGLITTCNIEAGRSWFHGVTENLLLKASASLGMPINLVKTSGEQYEKNFEKALAEAKDNGAEVCVFGDIDIEGHLEWCTLRCERTGLTPYFPLLNERRKKLVYEFIDSGFSSVITIVNTSKMSDEFLGQILSRKVADAIEASGADICGENGEYHTFTFDGPIFSEKIDYIVKERTEREPYAILSIDGKTENVQGSG
ncbi:MAG: diphthine--ammonia ligase [Acidobacteriota bacterium]|jgi:uncharacterized protein (TIGR00290 family)|nr:diphthine--ammonia ligase [Acidobacteriota bacterium]